MFFIILASIVLLLVVSCMIVFYDGDNIFLPIFKTVLVFLLVITAICAGAFSEYDYKDFTLKYSYVKNNNLYNLSIDEKEKYIEYVKFVNSEIDYAIKNWNSPCFGIYTDKRLLFYKKIEL